MNASQQFEAQGYTILKQFFQPAEIAQISSIVDRIYNQWRTDNHHALIEQQLINMHSLTDPQYFQHHPAERIRFFNLIASTKLTRALEQLFSTEIYFHNTQLFFNPQSHQKRPYWHRDLQYSPIDDNVQAAEQHQMLSLHVRIPLVAEKGVELIPGTHKRWDTNLEHNVRLERQGHRNDEPLPDSVLVELHLGDVLIFNAQMIHRGNYALNRERKALDLCLGKPHRLVAGFLNSNGLPNDQELEHIHQTRWYTLARTIAASTELTLD